MEGSYSIVVLVTFGAILCHSSNSSLVEREWDQHKHHNSCAHYLSDFYNAAQNFTTNILQHAVPVTYCNNSIEPYLLFEETYRNLTTVTDAHNVTCKYEYFNVDRLGVIETMYNQLHGMWTSGFCDDCYANTTSATISNTTVDFYIYWDHIHQCIEDHHKSGDPCLMCMGHYQKLNDFYDGIKAEKNDRICFDMQDAMNRTRILWSVKLNCCRDRNSSMLTAYIIAGVVSFLPAFFYAFVYCNRRYSERYEDLLSDREENASSTANLRSAQNSEDIEPGPSRPPQMPQEIPEVRKKERQVSDDSDDESLLPSTPEKSLI